MSQQEIEARVLEGLKGRLMAPELVREFIRAFQEEANRAAAELEQQFRSDRMQVEAVERKVAAIVAAIEEGHYSRVLGDRLAALERQQDSLLARVSETPPTSVRLHPRLADVYAEKVQQLEDALNDPAIRDEAADVLRSLIDRIELHPRDCDKGVDATLHGALAQILTLCGGTDGKGKLPEAGTSGSQLSVVAGARSHLYRTLVHYERNAEK